MRGLPAPIRRPARACVLAVVAAFTFAFAGGVSAATTRLEFVRDGKSNAVDRAAFAKACGARKITIDDPYYGRPKSYLACPLADALGKGFGLSTEELARLDVIFRAADGYAKPSTGALVTEAGGWLAFTDADRGTVEDPAWDPIDRKQVDPGPFYVVWEKEGQRDGHGYPWPYQLVQIELTSVTQAFPLVVPTGAAAGSPELAGFDLFRSDCIACHSINGQGGKIGPDLNVPRSIVEYRPEDQIKQYIRNPLAFRYTSMPAHGHLSDADLDALVAYFRAMSSRKHDPGKAL